MTEGIPTRRHATAAEIERRRKLLKLNAKEVSRRAKLGETAVGDIERGRSLNPGLKTLEAIASVLGCTLKDLTTAETPMADELDTPQSEYPPAARDEPPPGQVRIAELDLRAVSGLDGSWATVERDRSSYAAVDPHMENHVVNHWSFPAEGFATMFGAAADRVRLMRVIGDSMEPTLIPGQVVMVDTEDRGPTPPGIFVVWDGMGLVLKRVEGIAHSDPLTVRIMSDNTRYSPYDRLLEEAYIMGRVIGGWVRR